jgi:hypothetical protein
MKTLIILDKAGTIGLKYTIVEGDKSNYNGLVLNNETEIEMECINFLTEGVKNNQIEFVDSLNFLPTKEWDKAVSIVYYEPIPLKNLI